jgi:hypothetical protein
MENWKPCLIIKSCLFRSHFVDFIMCVHPQSYLQ